MCNLCNIFIQSLFKKRVSRLSDIEAVQIFGTKIRARRTLDRFIYLFMRQSNITTEPRGRSIASLRIQTALSIVCFLK